MSVEHLPRDAQLNQNTLFKCKTALALEASRTNPMLKTFIFCFSKAFASFTVLRKELALASVVDIFND